MEHLKLILFLFGFYSSILYSETCTFEYSIYNVREKKSLERKKVKTTFKKALKDKRGCSVCQEAQRLIHLKNGVKFKACALLSEDIRLQLNKALDDGFPIQKVIGYQPQVSRGAIDQKGNRTEFSNHSFGSAIDINPKNNGLYDNCLEWNSHCRLRKGGAWRPNEDPFSIQRKSKLIKGLHSIGLKWGGNLLGRQKDFMHFSEEGN